MSIKRLRVLLSLLASGLAAGALSVLVWGFLGPDTDAYTLAAHSPVQLRAAELRKAIPLEEFTQLWDIPLREPAESPAQTVPPRDETARSEQTTSVAGISLVGTILEAGESRAIFLGPTGEIDLKGVGEDLTIGPDGTRVLEIHLASVKLSYQGEGRILEIEQDEVP